MSTAPTERFDTRPWYRQAWPWFLISLPATAIVAGIATLVLAVRSYDGLVADDYYKQGLSINKRLAGEQLAASLGLEGRLQVAGRRVELRLQGREGVALPTTLHLSVISPVRAGGDSLLKLERQGDVYVAAWPPVADGHWNLLLEDPSSGWRVRGQMVLPAAQAVKLAAGT